MDEKYVWSFLGAIGGVLATLGAAMINYIATKEKTDVSRQKQIEEASNALRSDLLEVYRERENRIKKLERKVEDLEEKYKNLRNFIDEHPEVEESVEQIVR